MSENFIVNAVVRVDQGKGASRRLRRTGMVPGVVYGSDINPASISVNHNELILHLDHEAFYSHILTLSIDGAEQKVVLKDLQRHPAKPFIMHVDFQRIDESHMLKAYVPIHFVGEEDSPGVKQGGRVSHSENDVFVACLPKDLPEFVVVDLSALDLGDSVHLSDVNMPEGVVSVSLGLGEGHDLVVAALNKV